MSNRYFIGLAVPGNLAAVITTARQQFGEAGEALSRKSEPHLTLVPPFETQDTVDRMADELARSLALIEPFTATTTGLDSFPPKVWYLGVEPHESLVALHELTMRVVETRPDEYRFRRSSEQFHPHLTILTHLTADDFYRAKALLTKQATPATSWRVSAVTIYRYDLGRWQPVRSIPFSA